MQGKEQSVKEIGSISQSMKCDLFAPNGERIVAVVAREFVRIPFHSWEKSGSFEARSIVLRNEYIQYFDTSSESALGKDVRRIRLKDSNTVERFEDAKGNHWKLSELVDLPFGTDDQSARLRSVSERYLPEIMVALLIPSIFPAHEMSRMFLASDFCDADDNGRSSLEIVETLLDVAGAMESSETYSAYESIWRRYVSHWSDAEGNALAMADGNLVLFRQRLFEEYLKVRGVSEGSGLDRDRVVSDWLRNRRGGRG